MDRNREALRAICLRSFRTFGDAFLVVLVVGDMGASILVPADLNTLIDIAHIRVDSKARGPIVVS